MKLLLPVSFALAACSANAALRSPLSRRLSYEKIAEYEPASQVTDHNAIDLDQKAMEKKLGLGTSDSYQLAKDIYQQGAHSKSFAEVSITGGASGTIPAGAKVVGKTSSGAEVRGKVLDEVASGATTLKIQYKTTDIQDSYVDCQVGALGADGNTNGCFAASGTVEIDGFEPITYTYTVPEDSNNGRTIAGFSTGAKAKMYECDNCPYVDYKKFFDYYGSFDYANQWVLAAFSGGKTSFQNGNADFGEFTFAGRTESIKKGTAYMNVWMYVIREMEDALDDCKSGCIDCNDDPVHAWDEGVAFYTGSQQPAGDSTDGYLLYTLANKRCQNFRTCGEKGDSTSGNSKINIDIFNLFNTGQNNLINGRCAEAKDQKNRIAALMAVPLIQGTLRYAYLTDPNLSNANSITEKAKAEGAVFAASVLPIVHACSPNDAKTIYTNLAVGSETTDFPAVKAAFENNYACMNVAGQDVGGLWDHESGQYFASAAASNTNSSGSSGLSGGAIAGICIAAAVVVFGAIFLIWRSKRSSGDIDESYSNGASQQKYGGSQTPEQAGTNGHTSTTMNGNDMVA